MKKYLFYLAIIGIPLGSLAFITLLIWVGKLIYG